MYGLVNKAVEQMVCAHFSPEAWETIKERAGLDMDMFLSMRQYPDELTYNLVDAASHTLNLSHADILKAFGRYWMLYTAAEGYGELLSLTGSSLRDFLQNLPNLHARINLSFPHLHPPIFHSETQADGSMLLHYHSDRPGLAPMVVGMLDGLSERFQTPIDVEMLTSRDAGDDHEVFSIRFHG